MITKTCTKCNNTYPCNSDYFHKSKQHKFGYKNICKNCCSKYMKSYNLNQPKYKSNKTTRDYINKYRQTIKGDISHKISVAKRSYKFQHYNKVSDSRLTLTTDQFMSICDYFNWSCAYCGKDLSKPTISMVKRFSHGGDLEFNNVVCSCSECNKHKLSKTKHEFFEGCFEDWYKSYKYFSQDRYEIILNHITKG